MHQTHSLIVHISSNHLDDVLKAVINVCYIGIASYEGDDASCWSICVHLKLLIEPHPCREVVQICVVIVGADSLQRVGIVVILNACD